MKKKILACLLAFNLLVVPAMAFSVSPAHAASGNLNLWGDNYNDQNFSEDTGLGQRDPRAIVASVIRVILGFLGIVAVIIILLGGFKWMTAGGNDEQTGEAKKWIFSGIIGLAIILSAYALATYVINSLVSATTGP
jgi:hypothetical protein